LFAPTHQTVEPCYAWLCHISAGERILDLGCGYGLVGIVAALEGE
jgi:tRNA1(Val) A37 N6-methylase TrmN6